MSSDDHNPTRPTPYGYPGADRRYVDRAQPLPAPELARLVDDWLPRYCAALGIKPKRVKMTKEQALEILRTDPDVPRDVNQETLDRWADMLVADRFSTATPAMIFRQSDYPAPRTRFGHPIPGWVPTVADKPDSQSDTGDELDRGDQ